MLSKFKNISPQLFFIVAAALCSIVLNIVTPPFQANDEFNHFYRAYQITEGDFLPHKVDNRLGGEIPNSINKFVFPFDKVNTERHLTLTKQDVFNGFTVTYSKDMARFKDFPNTSYYSPVSYLPHIAAIFIAKQLNCSVGTMYYAGRLFTCLVWILCLYFVIKIVPIYKWLITAICLLPMNVFVANSFSADTVSNILSFLFIALILKHTFSENQFRLKDLVPLLIIISLLALAKVVYVALALSFLIIPAAKFKTKTQYFLMAGVLFATAFIFASYWSNIIMSKYTPYATYNPAYREWICLTHYSNYYEQKAYILSHGTYFFKVIYHSIFDHPITYLQGYLGTFGNWDIILPVWITYISYAALVFLALSEKNKFKFTGLQKLILFTASFGSFVLLLLSQHLTWDAVGEGVVDAVQGRYLIPIFPFLFFALGNYKFKFNINRKIIIAPLLLVLYTVSASEIYHRYYIGNSIGKTEFTCNAEQVNKEQLFFTSDPAIFLEGGGSKTDSVAYTGKSSVLLTEQSQFGFTYRFSNLNYGDLLEISVWQKGSGAQLVLSNDSGKCEKMYRSGNTTFYYDKNGWGKLYAKFLITQPCENIPRLFYVWNPTKEKICVDDLKFTIHKFKQ